jgi:hypothetical protein
MAGDADGVVDVAERGINIDLLGDAGHVRERADGLRQHRALGLLHKDLEAERLQHDEDIREDDRAIEIREAVDGLDRHLARQRRRAAHMEEPVLRADLTELREVAAGLAVQPHGHMVDREALGGAQNGVVL